MADLTIYAIGRLKQQGEQELQSRYLDRIQKSGPSLGIKQTFLKEQNESKQQNATLRKADESKSLLRQIPTNAYLIALDETGKQNTSHKFADFLKQRLNDGENHLCFALGGPDGHDEELINRSNYKLSLSSMTLPHGLARILLLEQIYRALTIWSGHPYHRD